MVAKVGLLLSGCGFLDGSEIHEAVFALFHLQRHGFEVVCIAPRGPQLHVVDHDRGEAVPGASRDMFVEAARIARGKLVDLAKVRAGELDALVLPGGFGAAKNLSDFAERGPAATVHPQVATLLREMHGQRKPIGAICIAPAVVAACLGAVHPILTVGADGEAAQAVERMGARHRVAKVTECVVDREQRLVTTPAYMYHATVPEVAAGIGAMVDALAGLLAEGGR